MVGLCGMFLNTPKGDCFEARLDIIDALSGAGGLIVIVRLL